ncbi:putative phosphoenolpyruvate synthase [Argiope bruennichi]|uniref:putative phosphoenolpyruvate synthase n=1 Tax=Argiope bruennichi TaxID=94029 RepID=UPI002494A26E|nr:putative phosphoenolpyruvate synthase [Argiope bruennichi]
MDILEFIYWFKWAVSYVTIRICGAFQSKRFVPFDVNSIGDPIKLGFLIPDLEKELESPFPESHLQEAADEITFYGVNSKSECLLVRIARGCDQQADAWVYLKLENGKTYHLLETKGFQISSTSNSQSFSFGKLQMYYLSPMRRWRIFYCGLLKEISENNNEEVVFVKLVFLWKAASDVYDCTLDTNPHGFASAVARSDWRKTLVPPIKNVDDALNFYGQSGVICGTVSVNDGPDYEMYLFGAKIRNLGKIASVEGCKFTTVLGNTPSNGLNFQLSSASVPFAFKNLPFGFVVDTYGLLEPLKELDIAINSADSEESQSSFKANFKTGERYELSGSIAEPIIFYRFQGWSGFLEISFIEFEIRNRKGYGVLISGEVCSMPKRSKKLIKIATCPKTIPLTAQFTEDICQLEEVSGGKGSSLGKLTQFSQEGKTFIVPKGIVVTTAAYNQFLTSEILEAVKSLEDVAYGNESGDLKTACFRVARVIEETSLPNKIRHSIIGSLKNLFGNATNYRKFAVRSSATGEDSATMSAAGQMSTFLGVQGLEEVFNSVKKCWASQFGHIAVEYKRRNGQILNSPMAVVIQDMVPCEVSGVLFTCDPVSNNPTIITITANYGLGETVVSGSVDPDTYVLRKQKDGMLEIENIIIGTKHQKIIMKEFGGTITEDIDEQSQKKSCLSKEDAKRLGKLSIKIENFYKCSRDIEWGMVDNKIFILQSRPVTNATAETDYEIKHEFDAPLRWEDEYFTKANVGEVMPNATSPLGIEVICKRYSNMFKREALKKGVADNLLSSRYYSSGLLPFYNHMMLTTVDLLTRYGYDTPKSKGWIVSIFGRVLDDPDLLNCAKERAQIGPEPSIIAKISQIPQQLRNYWYLFTFDFGLEKMKERIYNHTPQFLKTNTAKDTFSAILKACSDFDDALAIHYDATTGCSEWNMILFGILCGAKGSFDIEVYSDFAKLLATSSDVESATVPQGMQEVATQIVKDTNKEKFNSMPVEEAEEWLQTTNTLSGEKFRKFLKRHGHRCIKERDVHAITWEMDPKQLVKLLQNMASVTKEISCNKEESIDSILSQLKVSLDFKSTCMVKFILPYCRRGIRAREAGKSLAVKSFDHWRKGFRLLGRQMVSEGRLPDEELIFFLTFDEINDLLNTRSPTIISRASHRRKIFPTLDSYKFPEIMKGMPKPINDEEESADTYEFVADLTLKGIPVCVGIAKGYARVAMSLEEASHLKPGEILITYCTDIGWSPYFPIVSGVVTELGGLISHVF